FSYYNFEAADIVKLKRDFTENEKQAHDLASRKYYIPAYDLAMKCSHAFNVLDARGAISVSERVSLIKRIRDLSKICASAYVKDNHHE
ncbi:MAG: glycine--tRNA ligase subunit alpha, partial [Elusimicrobiales bacterium]|nr:glycine--tRNA ligase subunit alpha [Elusimicrobiales bacterium]